MTPARRNDDGSECVEQGRADLAKGTKAVSPNPAPSPHASRRATARTLIPLTLIALAAAAAFGGCTTASRREAYFKSRSDVVAGTAGTGEIRVATWPLTWAEDTALAFRDPDRLTDVGSPVPPID